MALQMNYYHSPLGVTFYNAYWRINPDFGIIGGKNGVKYTIEVYKDANTAHTKNSKCIKGFTHFFVPDYKSGAPNFIEQAYNHIKLHDCYGSVDV